MSVVRKLKPVVPGDGEDGGYPRALEALSVWNERAVATERLTAALANVNTRALLASGCVQPALPNKVVHRAVLDELVGVNLGERTVEEGAPPLAAPLPRHLRRRTGAHARYALPKRRALAGAANDAKLPDAERCRAHRRSAKRLRADWEAANAQRWSLECAQLSSGGSGKGATHANAGPILCSSEGSMVDGVSDVVHAPVFRLPTHTWHAKRFHMCTQQWQCALPSHRNDVAPSFVLRSFQAGRVCVQDTSYFRHITLTATAADAILDVLALCVDPSSLLPPYNDDDAAHSSGSSRCVDLEGADASLSVEADADVEGSTAAARSRAHSTDSAGAEVTCGAGAGAAPPRCAWSRSQRARRRRAAAAAAHKASARDGLTLDAPVAAAAASTSATEVQMPAERVMQTWLGGGCQRTFMLHERDAFPHRALAPVDTLWHVPSAECVPTPCVTLHCWVHVAAVLHVLATLRDACSAATNKGVHVALMPPTMSRFELTGTRSSVDAVLAALHPAADRATSATPTLPPSAATVQYVLAPCVWSVPVGGPP
ncbi:MAG: hypothetical protein EOO41_01805, partial [Methanobacteriota archaeon]